MGWIRIAVAAGVGLLAACGAPGRVAQTVTTPVADVRHAGTSTIACRARPFVGEFAVAWNARRIITRRRDTVSVFEWPSLQEIRRWDARHVESPKTVVSADGEWVAFSGDDGSLDIHRVETGERLTTIAETADSPRFSADAKALFFQKRTDQSATLHVFDLEQRTLADAVGPLWDAGQLSGMLENPVLIDLENANAIVGWNGSRVQIHDRAGRSVADFPRQVDDVMGSVAHEGTRLAWLETPDLAVLYDLATRRRVSEIHLDPCRAPKSLVIMPGGARLVAVANGRLCAYDTAKAILERAVAVPGLVAGVVSNTGRDYAVATAFDRDRFSLATGNWDGPLGRVRIYRLPSLAREREREREGDFDGVGTLFDSKAFVRSVRGEGPVADGTLRFLRKTKGDSFESVTIDKSGTHAHPLFGGAKGIELSGTVSSENGRFVAVNWEARGIATSGLLDLETGESKKIWENDETKEGAGRSLDDSFMFDPRSTTFLDLRADQSATLRELPGGREIARYVEPALLDEVSFEKGRVLVVTDERGQVDRFDLTKLAHEHVGTLRERVKSISVWPPTRRIDDFDEPALGDVVAPGAHAAAALWEGQKNEPAEMRVWDLDTGAEPTHLTLPKGLQFFSGDVRSTTVALALTPDGKNVLVETQGPRVTHYVASSLLHVFDRGFGAPVATLGPLVGQTERIVFRPDGRSFQRWGAEDERFVEVLEFPSGKVLTHLPTVGLETHVSAVLDPMGTREASFASSEGTVTLIDRGPQRSGGPAEKKVSFRDDVAPDLVVHTNGPAFSATMMAFSDDGAILAVLLAHRQIALVDPRTGAVKATIAESENGDAIAIGEDGTATLLGQREARDGVCRVSARVMPPSAESCAPMWDPQMLLRAFPLSTMARQP